MAVLQRNTSGYPLQLPTLGLGRLIHPGEDFDHDTRLAGFTPVEELDTSEAADNDRPGDTGTSTGTQSNDAQQPTQVATDKALTALPFATEEA